MCSGDLTKGYKKVELLHIFWDSEKAVLSFVP